MVTLQGVNTSLEEVMLSLDSLLNAIQDVTVEGIQNHMLSAEFVRAARKDLRQAMVSVASAAESLNMLVYLIVKDEACQKKSSSSQQAQVPDSTNEPDISTNLS